jgi:hypothetical protein
MAVYVRVEKKGEKKGKGRLKKRENKTQMR